MAPTSFGLQNFRVVVVKDTETRAKLKEVAYGQSQVSDSSMFLVFCVQKEIGEKHIENHIKLHSETKGVEISSLDGYKQMLLGYINNKPAEALTSWATRQAYIALGFGLFAAAEIGVDSCPMEGFDTTKFDEILSLHDKGLASVVCLAVGFRSETDKAAGAKKVRLPENELFI